MSPILAQLRYRFWRNQTPRTQGTDRSGLRSGALLGLLLGVLALPGFFFAPAQAAPKLYVTTTPTATPNPAQSAVLAIAPTSTTVLSLIHI